MSIFAQAAQALLALTQAAAGVAVTIRRGTGNLPAIPVTAVLGTSTFTTVDANGAVNEIRSTDFLIAVADYDFGQGPVEPTRGDTISRVVNGQTVVCQVTAQPGQQPFRYSDTSRQILRVHTKEVAA